MKLFLVIYIMGKVALAMGPISDTEKECQDKAEIIIDHIAESDVIFDGLSVAAACEFHDRNPVLEIQ